MAGAPRSLRGAQGLEATAARRPSGRPLYRGAADATAGAPGGGAGTAVQTDDGDRRRRRAAGGSGRAAVHGDAPESTVGGGPDVRGDLAWVCVFRLRH